MPKINEQDIVLIANFRQDTLQQTLLSLMEAVDIATLYHPQDVSVEKLFPAQSTQSFTNLRDCLRDNFLQKKTIIAFCATGIVVRALADLLNDKYAESPVLVMTENHSCIIPLLGGHRGGNALAKVIGEKLHIAPAITTASENLLGFALDEPPAGWKVSNTPIINSLMARLLAQQPVGLFRQFTDFTFPPTAPFTTEIRDHSVHVTDRMITSTTQMGIHPPSLVLGVGCERGCPSEYIETLISETFTEQRLAIESIAAIATVTLKADEPALRALAEKFHVPLRVFSPSELELQRDQLQAPSSVVFQEIGCHSVSEAAALSCAGVAAEPIVIKAKNTKATLSIFRRQPAANNDFVALTGQKLGKLQIIGTGPGDRDNLTLGALAALKDCDHAVGYRLYLDLVADLISNATLHVSPLGDEQKRVEQAITLAQEGKNVTLICSGDPGIYALATLVFEVLETQALRPLFSLKVHAGITAMQGAAAKLGAPLGHDFLAISLSDLLTPPQTIRQRLKAAAEGDFVVSFYNPQSKTRRALLPEAIETFLQYRAPETPVVICRNIGRADEKFIHTTLGTLQAAQVDMLSLVMIGNSMSKFTKNLQKTYLYTPRGYIEPIALQTEGQ